MKYFGIKCKNYCVRMVFKIILKKLSFSSCFIIREQLSTSPTAILIILNKNDHQMLKKSTKLF